MECLRYMRAERVMNAACGTDGPATVSASGSPPFLVQAPRRPHGIFRADPRWPHKTMNTGIGALLGVA